MQGADHASPDITARGGARRNAPRARASAALDDAAADDTAASSAHVPSSKKKTDAGRARGTAATRAAEEADAEEDTTGTQAAAAVPGADSAKPVKKGAAGRGKKQVAAAAAASAASAAEKNSTAEIGDKANTRTGHTRGGVEGTGVAAAPKKAAAAAEKETAQQCSSLPVQRRKRSSKELDLDPPTEVLKAKVGRPTKATTKLIAAQSRSAGASSGASGSEDFGDDSEPSLYLSGILYACVVQINSENLYQHRS